jgi:hypothetical protein
MQSQPQPAEFDIEEARRVLGDVMAPWVQDLGLSIDGIESAPPPGASSDWPSPNVCAGTAALSAVRR